MGGKIIAVKNEIVRSICPRLRIEFNSYLGQNFCGRVFYGTAGKKGINGYTGDGGFGDDVYCNRNYASAPGFSNVSDGAVGTGHEWCDYRDLYYFRFPGRFSHRKKGRPQKVSVGIFGVSVVIFGGCALLRRTVSCGSFASSECGCGCGASHLNDGAVPFVCHCGRDDQLNSSEKIHKK